MNGVNLNSPDLKLISSADQSPAKALSSSQGLGRNAPDLSASLAGARQSPSAPVAPEVSKAQGQSALNGAQREQLDDAVSQLNEFVQTVQRDLQFEVDNDLGQTVVKVVDQQTQEVIRQIPDEVALRLAEKLQQDEPLTLFNIKV